MTRKIIALTLITLVLALGCSDDEPSGNNGTSTNNGTTPSNNGTTPANNGNTTPTNNGTTPTNNGTTPTNNGTTPTNNGTTPTNNGTTPSVNPVIEAADQTADPATEVVVSRIVAAADGWIAIHEADGVSFGDIIGSAAVTEGEMMDVTVTLDRNAVDQEKLYAILHVDDPVDGNFTNATAPTEDGPVFDTEGKIVAKAFVVSVGMPDNAINAANQTLTLATKVEVTSAYAQVDGWVVIREDNAGAPGTVLGQVAVTAGNIAATTVGLSRPLADNETVHAVLHIDSPADGNFTFETNAGDDLAAQDGTPADTVAPIVATVAAGTPAVQFTLVNNGATSFMFIDADPARYTTWISDTAGDNPTLTLTTGWRYEIVNQGYPGHPVQFLTQGATPAEDVIQLGQDADGLLAADVDVALVENNDTFQFTLTPAMAAVVDAYRCTVHIATMRGPVVTQ